MSAASSLRQLSRREVRILQRMAAGVTLALRRRYPLASQYRLGPDFVQERDVQGLVARGCIRPAPGWASRKDAAEIVFRLTEAGTARLEEPAS